MPEEGPSEVRVTDKRVSAEAQADAHDEPDASTEELSAEPEVRVIEVNRDYLDDLRRLQAEFDNFRKRMMKQQSEASASGTVGLIRRLLPAIDHFQLAMDHGEAGSGVQLALKELMDALSAEGLEEIEAVGQMFDPNLHEAVAMKDDGAVDIETVVEVQRKGYSFKGQVLRAPYVVVARPLTPEGSD